MDQQKGVDRYRQATEKHGADGHQRIQQSTYGQWDADKDVNTGKPPYGVHSLSPETGLKKL